MNFENIYQFFQNPPPTFLSQELAACYVISVLLQGDSYGAELINRLENDYPTYRLSETVLYSALSFLELRQVISSYCKKVEKRGRPRRMFQLEPQGLSQATALACLWQDYMTKTSTFNFRVPQTNAMPYS